MTPNKNIPFYFAVKHIIKPNTAKLIYSIRYNENDYFILKTPGVNDAEQMDSHPKVDLYAFRKISYVLSEIEKEYKTIPPIEFINMDVFKVLAKIRNSLSGNELK